MKTFVFTYWSYFSGWETVEVEAPGLGRAWDIFYQKVGFDPGDIDVFEVGGEE